MTELLDLRLFAAALATWLGALGGLLLGGQFPLPTLIGSVLGLAFGGAAGWRGTADRSRLLGITLAALAVGCGSAALRVLPLTSAPLPELVAAGAAVRAEVVLTSDAVQQAAQVVGDRRGPALVEAPANLVHVLARGRSIDLRIPVIVRGGTDLLGLAPGTRLAVVGVLRPPGYRVGIAGVVSLRDSATVLARAGPVWRATTSLRVGLARACAGLSPDVRGLLPGLAVGDVSAVPPELVNDMKITGLTHLVAVSGTNTALVLAALLALCSVLRLRPWVRVGLALVGLAGFVLLVRPQPSVSRAAVMGVIAVVALVAGGRRRALPALCGAVLLLVLVDPWLAVSYGFALSTVATAGLVLIAPFVRDRLRNRLPWCPAVLCDAVAVSAAAQIAATPLLASLCGYLSVVSLPANVLAAPAVGPATVLGVLATLVAPLSTTVAGFVVHLAAVPTAWIASVAHHFAGFGWATLPWSTGLVGGLGVIAAIGAVAVLVRLGGGRGLRWWGVAVVVALLLIGGRAVARLARPPWPPPSWVLVVCDVGQGDGVVVRAGLRDAVVVDSGPRPAAIDGCLRRLRLARLAAVILTHFHADHVGGLEGVLHGRPVGVVYVSPYSDPATEAELVRRTLARRHLTPVPLSAGTTLAVGSAVLRVLWPPAAAGSAASTVGYGPNDDSVVLLIEERLDGHLTRMLLTGDAGPMPQAEIERGFGDLGVSVVKIAHHGSAYQSPGFARWLHAPLAVVSVGRGNPYGHPVAATLHSYRIAGATVVRTDESGDVAVSIDASGGITFATRG